MTTSTDSSGTLRGYRTTFTGLFDGAADIFRVEMPMIQRDYAQGRDDGDVPDIRRSFLDALLSAVAGGDAVSLDFVYGRLDAGTLRPLDGQQRLTTLFLLHWYVASAAGELHGESAWRQFSYATRPSARLFCARLTACTMPPGVPNPSEWIRDQTWYQFEWRHDPTIRSMLTMIDAIHAGFTDPTFRDHYPDYHMEEGWRRLIDTAEPAISFYVLPLPDLLADEELYIKMNSRGRPLSPFENLKAMLIGDIAHSGRASDFAQRIDGPWIDLFWHFDDGDDSVDAELQRYLDFVISILEYREGRFPEGRLRARMRAAFGAESDCAKENVDFLFAAFDAWSSANDTDDLFARTFGTPKAAGGDGSPADGVLAPEATPSRERPADGPTPVILFAADENDDTGGNLLRRCLYRFDGLVLRGGRFRLPHLLLLYAVLRHRIERTDAFPVRIRILRNLIAASGDEIRRERMPDLLADVDTLMCTGDLAAFKGAFASRQVDDEMAKGALLADHPRLAKAVYRLEDHELLRGTLTCIDLDHRLFERRAGSFAALFAHENRFTAVSGALLATGDYFRRRGNSSSWQFGAPVAGADDRGWRALLAPGVRDDPEPTLRTLAALLDRFDESGLPVDDFLNEMMGRFCVERERGAHFDWRYYLVKYPVMRSGLSGIYVSPADRIGYELVMMDYKSLNSYYRDPFLSAIWEEVDDADIAEPRFRGYLAAARWMRFTRTALRMRSVPAGFELVPGGAPRYRAAFERLRANLSGMTVELLAPSADSPEAGGTTGRFLLRVPQNETPDGAVDRVDRILVGAQFARAALAARL